VLEVSRSSKPGAFLGIFGLQALVVAGVIANQNTTLIWEVGVKLKVYLTYLSVLFGTNRVNSWLLHR